MTSDKNSKLDIIVRELSRGDFKDVIGNYYSVYDEVKQDPWIGILLFGKKPSLKDERKWFREALGRRNGFALVAEVGGEVVGLCDVRDKTPQMDQRHVGVVGILIRKGYRSMGVGSSLFEEMIKRARRRYNILVLSVFGNNAGAQNLYRKFGFRKYGVIPGGIERNGESIDDVYMYLKL